MDCCVAFQTFDVETPFYRTSGPIISLEDSLNVELIWYYFFSVLYSVCTVTCYSMPIHLRSNIFPVEVAHQEIFVSI